MSLPSPAARFNRDFYRRAPEWVARELLGQRLVRMIEGVRMAGRIVETEAYLGTHDRASHSYGGRRTPRNQSMYADGGTAYVFRCYGIHYLFNVVTQQTDEPSAVLIRAVEPEENLPMFLQHRPHVSKLQQLCNGPGKLTTALGIDLSQDGLDLVTNAELFLERTREEELKKSKVSITPRIGIDYAGGWAKRLLRFHLKNHPCVSR